MSGAHLTDSDGAAVVSRPSPVSRGVEMSVDESGLTARSRRELVLDVEFDGRRIWSLWLHRDGEQQGSETFAAWPPGLRRFLHGTTRVSVVVHESGEVLYDAEHVFGRGGAERIEVVDREGNPLATDKTGKLVKTFGTRSAEHAAPLLDAAQEVLDALGRAGVEAFVAYGTLLGAVREGRLLGHDSDADLGYVSAHSEPVDVMRESFRLQARLAEMGYETQRYSGAAFKVKVAESDGSIRGLDVFGGFLRDGMLYLMGEIRVPFRWEWLYPLGTAELEGRRFPVPAEPDRLLAAAYGAGWRTPDPAFHFATPPSTYRRLNGWFRGIRPERPLWDGFYRSRPEPGSWEPSPLARDLFDRHGTEASYVDVGCGHGVDALWLAGQGASTWGLDHVPEAFAAAAAREHGSARFLALNLMELRSVVSTGALLARAPGPRVVVARHLVDSMDRTGRRNLYRLADMATRDGGCLVLEFLSRRRNDRFASRERVRTRRPDVIARELERSGATVTDRSTLLAWSRPMTAPHGSSPTPDVVSSSTCRMVATWER
jgi:SAM-dependent methyltransferase